MNTPKITSVILSIYFLMCGSVVGQISEKIGNWRIESGPAGNEFYQAPPTKQIPPTDEILRWARIFVPHIEVSEWERDDDEYKITCQQGDEEYKLDVSLYGELTELQYENDLTDIEEEAEELVLRGTKKEIELKQVPAKSLSTLATAYPNLKASRAWTAETIAGLRYVIQIGKMVFYAREDGQMQAAGRTDDGGFNEIYSLGTAADAELKADLEKYLAPYQQRFNFENQIKKLGAIPKNADGSYRYLVLGDNRSNWELWSNMVKHIETLKPRPAFVINSGDIVPKGYAKELNEYYIPPLLKTDIPFFVAIGNHETGEDKKAREFQFLFGDNSLNYYFDYGKSRYIFADNTSKANSAKTTLEWLGKTLQETPQDYRKYVAAHKPPATISKWAYHAWDYDASKSFTDLMTKYNVAEVYLGHIHAYTTQKFGGINYTLSGGGGAGLHNRFGALGNVHHYVICDVAADGSVSQQVVRFYDTEMD